MLNEQPFAIRGSMPDAFSTNIHESQPAWRTEE
jgi:hypothetical protein